MLSDFDTDRKIVWTQNLKWSSQVRRKKRISAYEEPLRLDVCGDKTANRGNPVLTKRREP